MNLAESCGTDAFLIKSCGDVAEALYLLSLKFNLSPYKIKIKPRAKLLTNKCKE
jgi:hypothetical protein